MKKIIAIAAFAAAGATCYGTTVTQSLYYGSEVYAFEEGGEEIGYEFHGIGVRGVNSPGGTGFYYGADLFGAFPWCGIDKKGDEEELFSDEDLFLSLKAPLGYRWPATDKKVGLYVGGGPSVRVLSDIGNSFAASFGGFGEVGLQTNKTSGIGFHLGFQLGVSPVCYKGGEEISWDEESVHGTLQIGISWRRVAKD